MERRHDSRKPIRHVAALQLADDGSVTGVVQDIGPGGMLIETDRSYFPLNEALRVRFKLSVGRMLHEVDLNTVVIRHTDKGVALAFWGMSTDENRALNDILMALRIPAPGDKPLLS